MSKSKGLVAEEIHAKWIELGRNIAKTARHFGVMPYAVKLHLNKFAPTGGHTEKSKDSLIKSLRTQVKALEEQSLSDARVQQQIGVATAKQIVVPEWLIRKDKFRDLAGVPVLFASDWHFGEVVRGAEIGGVNEYNITIAKARARTMVQTFVRLLKKHILHSSYPGCVFILGGDMMSGDIHEELVETNEMEMMPCLLELVPLLAWCIETLADEFGKVFVPCVTGNHGRTSRKPRMKRRNHTNYDWLCYQLLVNHFAKDKRISFLIPEGPDAYFKIYDTRFLLTHGDQFRGGDGFAGAIVPIARGDKRKRARNSQTNRSYDVAVMGHWHQYVHTGDFVVNGSLKGLDEYAYAGNFGFELAAQAAWLVHPDHGITFRFPVYVQAKDEMVKTEWVSITRDTKEAA